jgi:hypothetical protein
MQIDKGSKRQSIEGFSISATSDAAVLACVSRDATAGRFARQSFQSFFYSIFEKYDGRTPVKAVFRCHLVRLPVVSSFCLGLNRSLELTYFRIGMRHSHARFAIDPALLSKASLCSGEVKTAPDRDVIYMGVPYPKSKFVNGLWYREEAGGQYKPFALQTRVHEIHGPKCD